MLIINRSLFFITDPKHPAIKKLKLDLVPHYYTVQDRACS